MLNMFNRYNVHRRRSRATKKKLKFIKFPLDENEKTEMKTKCQNKTKQKKNNEMIVFKKSINIVKIWFILIVHCSTCL